MNQAWAKTLKLKDTLKRIVNYVANSTKSYGPIQCIKASLELCRNKAAIFGNSGVIILLVGCWSLSTSLSLFMFHSMSYKKRKEKNWLQMEVKFYAM